MNKKRYLLWGLPIGFVVLAMLVCDLVVGRYAPERLYDDVDSIPPHDVGLLLATTPGADEGDRQYQLFRSRLDATVALYNAGKIQYILISGDKRKDGFDVAKCMKDSLTSHGISSDYMFLVDGASSIFDAVVRTNKEYLVKEFTVISHRSQNERALYIAEHLRLDVEHLQAFNAENPAAGTSIMSFIRECFARMGMMIGIRMNPDPEVSDTCSLEGLIYVSCGGFERDINTIYAHDEQDTIVGNFTGRGIDTIYVEKTDEEDPTTGLPGSFFIGSRNKRIPKVRLHGYSGASPRLVNEGDLDGNGTCDVGYLTTWLNSQYRRYCILTLVGDEWRYLVEGDYMTTSASFRYSGIEVAEPGKKKGTVLIHYSRKEYDPETEMCFHEIADTIVVPTFSKIEDD